MARMVDKTTRDFISRFPSGGYRRSVHASSCSASATAWHSISNEQWLDASPQVRIIEKVAVLSEPILDALPIQ